MKVPASTQYGFDMFNPSGVGMMEPDSPGLHPGLSGGPLQGPESDNQTRVCNTMECLPWIMDDDPWSRQPRRFFLKKSYHTALAISRETPPRWDALSTFLHRSSHRHNPIGVEHPCAGWYPTQNIPPIQPRNDKTRMSPDGSHRHNPIGVEHPCAGWYPTQNIPPIQPRNDKTRMSPDGSHRHNPIGVEHPCAGCNPAQIIPPIQPRRG